MKKLTPLIFIFVLFLSFSIPVFALESSMAGKTIIIDPGHGGSDPGSTACTRYSEKHKDQYYEKYANLDIAKDLEKLIEEDYNDTNVLLTRVDDSSKTNADRYNFANSMGGDVLLSIHLNGSEDSSLNGTLGLYGKRNKDLEFTKVIQNTIWGELSKDPLSSIFNNYGITNFASGVLLKSTMPATITESVYISNSEECKALTDGTGDRQEQIATSLFKGLENWFNQTSGEDNNDDDGDEENTGRPCDTPPCGKNK